jgi:hypothetical protein
MKAASAALLLLLGQDAVCDHGTRGPARPVDLREAARIQDEVVRGFTAPSLPRMSQAPLPSFDSGLPSCRARRTRTVRVASLPPDLKPLYFAPAGTEVPAEAILVASRARTVADAPLLAVREVTERFGIRCAPTWVRRVGPDEVELAEGGGP